MTLPERNRADGAKRGADRRNQFIYRLSSTIHSKAGGNLSEAWAIISRVLREK